MNRPSLTRRELVALVGVGAGTLVLGKSLVGTDIVARRGAVAWGEVAPAPLSSTGPATAEPAASAAPEAPRPGASDVTGSANAGSADSAAPATSALAYDDLPWNLRLINRAHPLPEDFPKPALRELPSGYAVDERIYDATQAFMKAARKAGHEPVVCSAYRSHEKQRDLYRARVRQSKAEGKRGQAAKDDAAFWVAPPYASEHEAGIALDLVDAAYQELDEKQEKTKTQQWLMAHCADYGFILRYPTDKSATTGIGYEPWHYRYVGEEAARAITASGLCFEEWIEGYLKASTVARS